MNMDTSQQHHGLWLIGITILLALLLSLVPMEGVSAWARPDWLLLVMFFWLLALPGQIGVVTCWFCGLLQDILYGAVLGQNAFAMAVIAYIVLVSYQRLRMFSLHKQAALVALLALFRILVDQWAQNINGVTQTHWLVFLPALTTCLLWFVIRPAIGWLQRMVVVF
ncbi:rod shape-determining protein MreD [Spongiibacter nanhainus]|uniref:Rod shape-determining protein MreD n=2 Tax=Spongiibacter nanhainus TaxID=2794344 RepID=A0A7T4R237_9GAMM|nr:rod shape-determining protein MreD [Spongiibacter nanhainus]